MPVSTHVCIAIKLANLPFSKKPLQSRMHLEILLKCDSLTSWAWILPELFFACPLSLEIFQTAACSYWDGGWYN